MTCEECEALLVDLVCGDLDEPTARHGLEHVAHCAPCRDSFDRMREARELVRGLAPIPTPRHDTILAIARECTAARRGTAEGSVLDPPAVVPAGSAVAPATPNRATPPRIPAMAPQLGALVVLLLVTSVGLWHLPRRDDAVSLLNLPLESDAHAPRDESLLSPAEPLRLARDPRTGRVVAERLDDPRPAAPRGTARPEGTGPAIARSSAATLLVEHAVPVSQGLAPPAGETLEGPMPDELRDLEADTSASSAPSPSDPHAAVRNEPGAILGEARHLATLGRCAEALARYDEFLARTAPSTRPARAPIELDACTAAGSRATPAPIAVPTPGPAPTAPDGARVAPTSEQERAAERPPGDPEQRDAPSAAEGEPR